MENNESLKNQNNIYQAKIKDLSSNISDLKEQAQKFKDLYQKLLRENEKLAKVRDDLQEQLGVCDFNFSYYLFLNMFFT